LPIGRNLVGNSLEHFYERHSLERESPIRTPWCDRRHRQETLDLKLRAHPRQVRDKIVSLAIVTRAQDSGAETENGVVMRNELNCPHNRAVSPEGAVLPGLCVMNEDEAAHVEQ
jgi:hypothetical protein